MRKDREGISLGKAIEPRPPLCEVVLLFLFSKKRAPRRPLFSPDFCRSLPHRLGRSLCSSLFLFGLLLFYDREKSFLRRTTPSLWRQRAWPRNFAQKHGPSFRVTGLSPYPARQLPFRRVHSPPPPHSSHLALPESALGGRFFFFSSSMSAISLPPSGEYRALLPFFFLYPNRWAHLPPSGQDLPVFFLSRDLRGLLFFGPEAQRTAP